MKNFTDGARVCFVGDSITHKGIFIKHIVAYYRKYFPNLDVEFYNCGISGGTLGNTLKVYDEDIDIYKPTHIVLMIGINDSARNALAYEDRELKYNTLVKAYETYRKNLDDFYKITQKNGIELILCTPTPYDEYQQVDTSCYHGAYALLLGYANYVREFANENKLLLCDYHTAFTRTMQLEPLIISDRVHPNERGHFIMAKTFLEFQGLELSEAMEFSPEIEEWYVTTQKIRNAIATEYFMVPDYTERSHEERLEHIKKIRGDVEAGAYVTTEYFKGLINEYENNKLRQNENIDFVKQFMKR